MIQDIDEINVNLSDPGSVDISIDNDNSISVSEAAPTDIAQIMHNEEIRIANENERIANETQRIANEEAREDYITDLKQRVLDGEFNGEDGYSPTATVSKTDSTATITITDKNGTTTAQISDGTDGVDGRDGTDGEDGISPTVTMTKQGKVTTLTITDKDGEHTTEIKDGNDGYGTGDMLKATYDTNDNGIVDNAEKVNNHTVLTDVPANAVFTDTTYTAGTGIDITNNVISSTQSSAEWGNITGILADQTDLMTALGLKLDNYLQNVLTGSSENDPIILDGLTPGTYPLYSTTEDIHLKLKSNIQYDRFLRTDASGTNAFLIVPKTIDYDSLEDNDEIFYTIHCQTSGTYANKGARYMYVTKWKYAHTYGGEMTNTSYVVYLGRVLTNGYQEIDGIKSFNDGVSFIDSVSTYGTFNINVSDEDETAFNFNGTSSDTPTWNYKVDFDGGLETSVAPTSGNDITNKTYVDNGLSSKQATIDSSHKLSADLVDDTSTTNKFFSGNYNDLTNKPTIPDELADLSDDSTHRVVTDTEKAKWNGKQNAIDSSNKLTADLVNDSNSVNKFVTASDKTTWSGKQDALVSGTNIKTINSTSILGSGNIDVGVDIPQQDSAPSNPQEDDLWIDTDETGYQIAVDNYPSTVSTNPVENQAITNYVIDSILPISTKTDKMNIYREVWNTSIIFNMPIGSQALVLTYNSDIFMLWNPADNLSYSRIAGGTNIWFSRAGDLSTVTASSGNNATWTVVVFN